MNRKAISLLSGGLDSLLATKLIMEQGIEVVALHFTSPFCTCTKGNNGCGMQAIRSAKELIIESHNGGIITRHVIERSHVNKDLFII